MCREVIALEAAPGGRPLGSDVYLRGRMARVTINSPTPNGRSSAIKFSSLARVVSKRKDIDNHVFILS